MATGFRAREGGWRWARERRCSPGTDSLGRGRRRMRPSWRTATSGPADPRGDPECLGKRPGYLKPIERWSARRDGGACGRLGRPPASRARQGGRGGAAKWERRRLQALERAGGSAGAAGPAGADARHPPGDAGRRPARAGPGIPEAIPDAAATPAEATNRRGASRRGGTTWRWRGCRSWSSSWSGRSDRGLAAPRGSTR